MPGCTTKTGRRHRRRQPAPACRACLPFNNAFYAVRQKARSVDGAYAPTVSVRTKDLGGHVEIRVRDNGTGIPAEIRQQIFEPFFTTKPTGSGNTGLGLSLSYDIVVQGHSGAFVVESEDGVFTEFIITLPA